MGKGDGGGKGPPKNPSAGRITRVLGKSITIHADDEHDADPFGEAPAHHADAIQKEKGFFTYGGGGYRGKQEAKKYDFVDMDDEEPEEDGKADWDDKFGGDTDLRGAKKDKKSKKSSKKRKKESADSDSDSDSSDDKKHKKKHKKKSKKHKKEKEQRTVLPDQRADQALVALLRSGCSSSQETKQLLSMLDGRQVILTGGVQDRHTRKLLEGFLEALGGCTKIKSTQGVAYEPSAGEVLGIKLTRHYSHVLEKYARNPVSKKKNAGKKKQEVPEAAAPSPEAEAPFKGRIPASSQSPKQEAEEEDQQPEAVMLGPQMGSSSGLPKPEEPEPAPVVHVGPMMPGDFTRDELAKLADERAEGVKLNEPGPQRPGEYTMQQLQSFEVARALEEEQEETGRDDWMLTLPAEGKTRAQLGAGDLMDLHSTMSRGFNTKSGPAKEEGSRDKWVETPADRERKRLAQLAGVIMHHTPSDTIAVVPTESDIQPYGTAYSRSGKSQSSKSLLEQHQDKEKKQAKEEKKKKQLVAKPAPLPFDRERDLEIQSKPKLHDLKKLKQSFGGAFASSGFET